MAAAAVDEDKGIAAHHLAAQFIVYNATEAVKAFTHVGLPAVKMIAPLIGEMNDAAHLTSAFKNAALTGWKIRMPFTSANNEGDEDTSTTLTLANPGAVALLVTSGL